MPASSAPSAFWGLSKSTLANVNVTSSVTVPAIFVLGDARDQYIRQLDDEILLLALTGLAAGDGGFLDVRAGRHACQRTGEDLSTL